MKAFRVTSGAIKVGDPVPWNVLDQNGKLLLKKGAVVTSQRVMELLVERGCYLPQDNTPSNPAYTAVKSTLENTVGPFNPFEIIEACTFRLGRVLFNLTQGKDCSEMINVIANDIIQACEKAPDATLGAVHLLHGHAYTTIHPIHVATLCHALCSATHLPADETRTIIEACLTSNIGMLELQEVLHEQTTPLTDEQKQQIQLHPQQSVEILKTSGIQDPLWLDIVMQHHERSHGEGYPKGLKSEEIVRGAKILAITDCYSAMISPRAYKDSMEASAALKTLFLERGKAYDETLAVLLIKYMGVFPPGAFVKLNNGEVAVVVRRTDNNMAPEVASVISPKEAPYTRPIQRDSSKSEFSIKGIVENKRRLAVTLSSIWGYQSS